MTTLNKSLTYLSKEHTLIENFFSLFENALFLIFQDKPIENSDLQLFLDFSRSYDCDYHYAKEERFLFPALDNLNMPTGGGPECGFFYDIHMDIKSDFTKQQPIPPSDLSQKLTPGSPLNIPLDEHEMSKCMIKKLQEKLESQDLKGFANIGFEYMKLMRAHAKKENDCLFIVANTLIPPEEDEKILEDFKIFDKENRHLETQAFEIFETLKKKFKKP